MSEERRVSEDRREAVAGATPKAPGDVRLRDVAREAGVHVATASRALNPRTRDRVHPRTAAKVDEAAARLGYEVNLAARTLRTQRSEMVGVLIPDISRPLYPPMMRGIVDVLEEHGHSALLVATDEDEQRERRLVSSLRARGVDGFILATAHLRHPLLEDAATLGVPTVTLNRTATDAPVSSVAPDNEAGMADVAAHLVALGHRRIAHIAGPADTSTGRARSVGLHQALARLGVTIAPALDVVTDTYAIAEGVRAARRLLMSGEPFSAVVTGNDLLALGAIDVLRENRIDCPAQVSVTGFNDLPMMDRVTPALTTVRVPQYAMGRAAAQLLMDQLLGTHGDAPGAQVRHVVLPVELVVRESTGRPPASGVRRMGRPALRAQAG
ncbi:MAG: LacI family DNA-binding transcriptional regulator [Chloroflexota bacterium]